MTTTRFTTALLLVALLVLPATTATAQSVTEPVGTAPGGGSRAGFGTPNLPQLPADFFGPGSEPFQGEVTFGRANADLSALENVLRIEFPEPPMTPADPPGLNRTIPAELVELNLVSAVPVEVTFDGGAYTEFWDVTMSLSTVPTSPGQIIAVKDHANGGNFILALIVQPRFEFERIADGLTLVWDTGLEGIAPLYVDGTGFFVHEADPLLRLRAENDGLFVFGVEELVWGDRSSQCPALTSLTFPGDSLTLQLAPLDAEIIIDGWCLDPGVVPDCSYVEFGPSSNPPLPADFFGPGSDPFEGQICLQGDPIGPTAWGDFGTADLLIRGAAYPFDRCSLPDKADEVTSVNVVGYKKIKLPPIELPISFNGGATTQIWDMSMTLDPAGPATGLLTATKSHAGGGTFDLTFSFSPRFVFRRESDGFEITLDASAAGRPPLEFSAAMIPWVHTVDTQLGLLAPGQGRFVPGVVETVPGDSSSQEIAPMLCEEAQGAAHLVYLPVPGGASGADLPPHQTVTLAAHPNPFNPLTSFVFALPEAGPVTLRIHDPRGRVVRTLLHDVLPAGEREVVWQGIDDNGHRVASGVYLGVLQTRAGLRTCKLALIK